jgi:hypothetical protein
MRHMGHEHDGARSYIRHSRMVRPISGSLGRVSDDLWPYAATRNRGTIPDMDESTELQHDGHWRMAVWALRVGFGGLSIVLAGLIVVSLGNTRWVLAAGMFIWLACAVVMAVGFLLSRHELPEPRPGFWSMRFMLIHDTVRARPSAQQS